eukprot:CAMPEP_0185789354 /NCGR_PEP_ID=MMETSP1174-20130828/150598_1 /TAXON_ID=35687 /ORGANISM="Dictyocha speculum, Strain CCMP1381" /LENGTH=146 /DNA_ID=CAMNT_0028483443 /DNA_START=165 /DNA_END=602 /DNA_ORIENTATION=-
MKRKQLSAAPSPRMAQRKIEESGLISANVEEALDPERQSSPPSETDGDAIFSDSDVEELGADSMAHDEWLKAYESECRERPTETEVLDGPVKKENDQADACKASFTGVKLKDDPDYAPFFKMLRVGLPLPMIQSKVRALNLDPNVL